MKLIFILLLVASCGKHTEPAAVDFRDSDGDRIPNAFEKSDLDKYIADIEDLGHVKGTIQFHHEKDIQIQFSNRYNFRENILKTMVSNEVDQLSEDYFDEWMRLHISGVPKTIELHKATYVVHIHFQTTKVNPEELVLVNGKAEFKLGKWDSYMKLNLSSEDLTAILSGESYLRIKKKFFQNETYGSAEDTIKERTYRLYLDDGRDPSLLYVSHELPVEELIRKKGIKEAFQIKEEELFFSIREQSSKKWFLRSFSNGDHVLAFTTLQEVNQEYLKRFNYQKKVIKRSNGSPDAGLPLNNKSESNVLLRIRGTKTIRTFKERSQRKRHVEGGGSGMNGNGSVSFKCTHHIREIKNETRLYPRLEEIAQSLNLSLELASKIEEKVDERGIYWDIRLDAIDPNYVLKLFPRDKSTYVVTGEYDNSCRHLKGNRAAKTNLEGQFQLEVESFVEKIP